MHPADTTSHSPLEMPDAVTRLNAALADRYRVEREIGAGGMATVYLAHDLRHGRKVALKVLRAELAAAVGVDRFLAEIKTTASLQHPHILGLIDSGTVAGTVFYVMPFVDGESLRDRLAREKQLPIADAVRIATAVAGALDHAHRRGVIHRDIKPANILLQEGQALIADFGIALPVRPLGESDQSDSRMTETGLSLGTPRYMSPEQAMGERDIDARTDIFSLGCVLYEMLTGEPPFTGPSVQAVIAKIMSAVPEPVTTLRRSVPANVAAATMTAINKLPADRFATAADLAAALNDPGYTAPYSASVAAPARTARFGAREISAIAAIVLLGGAAIAGWMRSSDRQTPTVTRFAVALPATGPVQFVISPDGSRLLWSNSDGYWERRLDGLTPRRLRDPAIPQSGIRSVSPDGRDVLLSGRGGMAIASLTQGPARPTRVVGRGGVWGADGYIYFVFGGPPGTARGIARVFAATGAVDTLAVTGDRGVPSEVIPLPGGRAVVVAFLRAADAEIVAFDLNDRTWHSLGISGTAVQYVAPGYLLYATGQYLMAAPFDVKRLVVTKPPLPLAEAQGGSIERFAVGGDVLAYLPEADPMGAPGIVVRSRRGGQRSLPNLPDSVALSAFAVSPDGQLLAATGTPRPGPGSPFFMAGVSNIFIIEFASGRVSRWRSDARESNPSWMPGGRDLTFIRVNPGASGTVSLMRRPWDASADATPIHTQAAAPGRGLPMGAAAWFPDGRRAVIQVVQDGSRPTTSRGGRPSSDLMMLSLAAPDSLRPFLATEFSEGNPAVSPDGRAVAYSSNESGRTEVYVRTVDGRALRQVSINGGAQPEWAHSGHELFYRDADTLFAARVSTAGELSVGAVTPVLTGGNLGSGYAVGAGDSLFVMRAAPTGERPTSVSVIVVTSVATELRRLFAAQDGAPPL